MSLTIRVDLYLSVLSNFIINLMYNIKKLIYIKSTITIYLSSLLPQKQDYIGPTDFWLGSCNVESDLD